MSLTETKEKEKRKRKIQEKGLGVANRECLV